MKRLLRTTMLALVRLYGALTRRGSKKDEEKQHAPRILLLRPDHLGDVLLITPILDALRTQAPDAEITLMVGPWSSAVIERHPAVNHVRAYEFPGFQRAPQKPLDPYIRLFKSAKELQQEDYDVAINLRPDFWWGAALLYLSKIPRRIGYAIAPGTPFLTQAIPLPEAEAAPISNLRLTSLGLQAAGYQKLAEPFTAERYPLSFSTTEEERIWIYNRLSEANVEDYIPIVVIHPGTGGEVKLWRNEAWARTAHDLITTKVTHIVLTGTPVERPRLEAITHDIPDGATVLTDLTVGQLAALLQRARLVLGVDNGPLHLAAAVNTPSLRLYGPTDARIFGPWGSTERHRVIKATEKCATCPLIPCGRLDFTSAELPDHPCVKNISEQIVEQNITDLIQTTSSML